MAISFISPEVKSEFRQDKSLLFAAGMVLFLLLVFIGLKIYNTQIKGQIYLIEDQIKQIDEEIDKDLEKEMKGKLSLLDKGKIIIDSHTNTKNIFDLLEKKTHERVLITDLTFSAEDNTIIISTESLNDVSLATQTVILQSAPEIEDVKVTGISKEEGIFKFQFTITLKEKIINFLTKIK